MDRATLKSVRRESQSRKARDNRSTGRAFMLTLDRVTEERRRDTIRKSTRQFAASQKES